MKKIFNNFVFVTVFYFYSTVFSLAATVNTADTFKPVGSLISSFTNNVINTLGTMFGAAALTVFFYGVVVFITNQANGGAKLEEGKKFMLWGLVALFVMVSVWGITIMFQNLLGIDKNANQVNLKPICIQGINDKNCVSDSGSAKNPSIDTGNLEFITTKVPTDSSSSQ